MSEQYVTLAELRELLEEEEQKRDMLASQKAALHHAQTVCAIDSGSAKAIMEEVGRLECVTDDSIALKIADLLPDTAQDVRAIFYKERIALSDEDIDAIIEIVHKKRN